jgi:hypothetical protein
MEGVEIVGAQRYALGEIRNAVKEAYSNEDRFIELVEINLSNQFDELKRLTTITRDMSPDTVINIKNLNILNVLEYLKK